MKYILLRILSLVSIALFLSALVVRLAWEITFSTSAGSLVVIILLMLVAAGLYALLLYLTIKPSLKKLKKLPVSIGVIAVGTAALIDGIIHFIRFVPSPEAYSPISVVIAGLLLGGGVSAYLAMLWVVWHIRKAKG
ncbi:hypothetical protein ACFLTZ_03870 [Chloroflexota bacterium]